jgi:hypothetical protein
LLLAGRFTFELGSSAETLRPLQRYLLVYQAQEASLPYQQFEKQKSLTALSLSTC